MASCLRRYCRRILCCCSPCMLLLPVYLYVTMALFFAMKYSTPIGGPTVYSVLPLRFVASGLKHSSDLAPHPEKSFWKTELESGALWNFIQHVTDRQNNPILRPGLATSANLSSNLATGKGTGCSPDSEIISKIPDYSTLPTLMKNFVTAMHCRDYPLIIAPEDVCDHGPLAKIRAPVLLLAIKTQTANFENREAIRQTWGRTGMVRGQGRQGLVRRVFLLGKTEDLHTEKELQLEANEYGDIIQWDFMDTFFNLTLKDVLFWDWFSRLCPHAHFIFKGDDDVFVRMPAVLDYLLKEEEKADERPSKEPTQPNEMEGFVVGDVINNAMPIRSNGTKYYIPESFYKGLYPSYPGGGGVVYSGSLAHRLFEVSQWVHIFPIDDVYLGMCLKRLGVSPIHHPAFLTFDFPKEESKDPCANHTILLVHKRSPAEMFRLWNETSMPSSKCRNATLRVKPRVD
ncbi:N-acetyllactosaminide beta-1,3-N-acetylglucosaminyltransferase 2-like [Myxocyprinus asiaticus]|uniref:N-acetyllactosaminide beta-1,3-N-acetylglucosaminyltransferase 2-like n=1 Tax=Myxocyprinus asiaticus TaxID=70543 RepID=UPI002222F2C4|nr:N-acetyllactosaminide beta-1,3-N-acetylglucosaminyltransferase 2-like [Myxocyprinus asiaticus]